MRSRTRRHARHTSPGRIPAALGQVGPDLLAKDPDLRLVDVIAVKAGG